MQHSIGNPSRTFRARRTDRETDTTSQIVCGSRVTIDTNVLVETFRTSNWRACTGKVERGQPPIAPAQLATFNHCSGVHAGLR
jgi:hypothetical protein